MSKTVRLQLVTGTPGARGVDGAPGIAGAGGNASGVALFEDFLGSPKVASGVVSYGGPLTLEGATASSGVVDKTFGGSLDGHPGVIAVRSAGGATAKASLYGSLDGGAFTAGSGTITFEMLAQINAANDSAGAQRYHAQFGISATIDGTVDDNGLGWFEYGQKLDNSGAVDAGNVLCHAFDTTQTSSFAPDTGWHKYGIIINAAGNSVQFLIDGVVVTTIAKDVSSFPATVMVNVTKVAGITNRGLFIDYMSLAIPLTTSR